MNRKKIIIISGVVIILIVGIIWGRMILMNNNEQANENRDWNQFEGKNPVATITMKNNKQIKLELYPRTALNTVFNFIDLVQKDFYDGLIFHRVIKGFMIQGGDPKGTGTGGPGYSIKGEFKINGFDNDLSHNRGVISMARSGHPDSAGSQFFIMHQYDPRLDGQYAAFGQVIEGIEVVDEIANVKTGHNDKPVEPQIMKKVTVETFGVDYPEPEKL